MLIIDISSAGIFQPGYVDRGIFHLPACLLFTNARAMPKPTPPKPLRFHLRLPMISAGYENLFPFWEWLCGRPEPGGL